MIKGVVKRVVSYKKYLKSRQKVDCSLACGLFMMGYKIYIGGCSRLLDSNRLTPPSKCVVIYTSLKVSDNFEDTFNSINHIGGFNNSLYIMLNENKFRKILNDRERIVTLSEMVNR